VTFFYAVYYTLVASFWRGWTMYHNCG